MAYDFNENPDRMEGYEDSTEEEISVESEELPVPGTPASYAASCALYEANELQVPEETEEDYEKVLSQVDRRMRVAHYYRSILDSSIFDEETSEAKIVQGRIRKFCNEELEVIFGMRSAAPVAAAQFTPEEVVLLKTLISRLSKETTPGQRNTPPKPTVNRVASKPFPQAPVKPTQTNPPQAQSKPQPAPVSIAPVQSKPKPVQTSAPAKPQVAQTKPQETKPEATQPNQDPRIPEKYRNDPTAKVANGRILIQLRNDDGVPLWSVKKGTNEKTPVMKDVTPPAVPGPGFPQPIPMPSCAGGANSPFSQATAQHAMATEQTQNRINAMANGSGTSLSSQISFGIQQALTG